MDDNAIRLWLCLSIFRVSWSRSRFAFETNVALEILCMYGEWSLRSLVVHALSFRDLVLFFFLFFFGLRLVNLEPRFKFQRALRPKEEDRRGPTNCHEEGCNEWLLIFWIFFWIQRMGSHCYYFVIVLVLVICSNCCAVWPICMPAHHPNPVIMGIAIFLLVLRMINYGLN